MNGCARRDQPLRAREPSRWSCVWRLGARRKFSAMQPDKARKSSAAALPFGRAVLTVGCVCGPLLLAFAAPLPLSTRALGQEAPSPAPSEGVAPEVMQQARRELARCLAEHYR